MSVRTQDAAPDRRFAPEHGLLRDTTTFVHANEFSDEELSIFARRRQFGVDQPGSELKTGFGSPMTRPGARRYAGSCYRPVSRSQFPR